MTNGILLFLVIMSTPAADAARTPAEEAPTQEPCGCTVQADGQRVTMTTIYDLRVSGFPLTGFCGDTLPAEDRKAFDRTLESVVTSTLRVIHETLTCEQSRPNVDAVTLERVDLSPSFTGYSDAVEFYRPLPLESARACTSITEEQWEWFDRNAAERDDHERLGVLRSFTIEQYAIATLIKELNARLKVPITQTDALYNQRFHFAPQSLASGPAVRRVEGRLSVAIHFLIHKFVPPPPRDQPPPPPPPKSGSCWPSFPDCSVRARSLAPAGGVIVPMGGALGRTTVPLLYGELDTSLTIRCEKSSIDVRFVPALLAGAGADGSLTGIGLGLRTRRPGLFGYDVLGLGLDGQWFLIWGSEAIGGHLLAIGPALTLQWSQLEFAIRLAAMVPFRNLPDGMGLAEFFTVGIPISMDAKRTPN